MKKTIVILIILLSPIISCKPRASDYTGTWKGGVIIVDVEYTFTKTTYESKTTSFNNVVIHSSRGRMAVEGNIMHINEEERYLFDTKTNTGKWIKSHDSYDMEFKLDGNTLTLRPSTAKESITLTRQ